MPNEKIDRRHENPGKPKEYNEPRLAMIPFRVTASEKQKIIALGYPWLREQLEKVKGE